MNRKFKAFISYRHLPLDISVAKKVHRSIEHYIIPKDLRVNGQKRLGYVFLDQDELQASSDLPASLCESLDNSEYLIVICTPETKKSRWVRSEITYFLEHHDRDHVLVVLAAGSSAESLPSELTDIRAEDGTLTKQIEPLAANVFAENSMKSRARRSQYFKKEILRIISPMIGCGFDELYRREQRYIIQRIGVVAGVFAIMASAFIGVLLNRNAEIKKQMLNAKISESKALVGSSLNSFQNGDYRGALNAALDALPGRDKGRPFIPAAEAALSEELYLYRTGLFRYVQSIEEKTSIKSVSVSNEHNILITQDAIQLLRAYDTVSGKLLWEHSINSDYLETEILERNQSLLVSTSDSVFALSLRDGTCIWEKSGCFFKSVSESQEFGLFSQYHVDENGWNEEFLLVNLNDGSIQSNIQFNQNIYVEASALSQDNRYAAVLMDVESVLSLFVLDFQEGKWEKLPEEYSMSFPFVHYRMCFGPKNELVLAAGVSFIFEADGIYSFVCCYDSESNWNIRFKTEFEVSSIASTANGSYQYFPSVDFLDCNADMIAVGTKNILLMLDMNSGEFLWRKQLPGHIGAAKMYENKMIGLVLSNGLITFCTPSGLLSHESLLYCFETDYNLYTAAISGSRPAESSFAVVSAKNHRCTSIIRRWDNTELTRIVNVENSQIPMNVFCSSTGKWLAFLSQYDDGGISGVMVDTEDGYEKYPFQISKEEWVTIDQDKVFVTEQGIIIAKDLIVDPWEETCSGISKSGEIDYYGSYDVSCYNYHDNTVLTASIEKNDKGKETLLLWENGIIIDEAPFPEENPDERWGVCTYKCTAIGGNGYVIISRSLDFAKAEPYYVYSLQEKNWQHISEFCILPGLQFALADNHVWLAVMNADNALEVYDLQKGDQQFSIDCEIPVSSIVKVAFAYDDRLIVAFSSDAGIILFDTKEGKELCSINYGHEIPCFDDTARIVCYPVERQDRILIVYDDPWYNMPAGFVISTSQWELEGQYPGVTAYLSKLNHIIVDANEDAASEEGFFFSNLLSLNEIMEKAETILEEGVVLK